MYCKLYVDKKTNTRNPNPHPNPDPDPNPKKVNSKPISIRTKQQTVVNQTTNNQTQTASSEISEISEISEFFLKFPKFPNLFRNNKQEITRKQTANQQATEPIKRQATKQTTTKHKQ